MKRLEAEILNTEQVALIFGMKPGTVGDYARRGILPSFMLGKHRRFTRSEIERWIADQEATNPYR